MEKYFYKFCVYKNNMRDGVQFVRAFDSLVAALNYQWYLEMNGGGCCDVVKKRFFPGDTKPRENYIYNNYKYSEADL